MAEVAKLGPGNYLVDGEPRPSVTTVLGVLDKSERLMPWASKMTAAYLWDAYDRTGEITELDIRRARAVPWAIRDQAGEWGTQLHHLAERTSAGQTCNLYGYPTEVLTAFQAWCQWWMESRLRVEAREQVVYLERARLGELEVYLGVPGTLDLCGLTPVSRRLLVDYKTSNYLHPEFALQVVAYATAWESSNWPEQIDACQIVRFEKDSEKFVTRPFEVHEIPRSQFEGHLRGFVACKQLWDWKTWAVKARKEAAE